MNDNLTKVTIKDKELNLSQNLRKNLLRRKNAKKNKQDNVNE